jgi:uncharacterized protein (UPF0332 family)
VPFDWSEYASLGSKLASDASYASQARLRAAASRVYYAAHWAARARVEAQPYGPIPRAQKDKHREVIRRCEESGNPTLQYVATLLDRALEKRVKADYRADEVFKEVDFGVTNNSYARIVRQLASL